MIGILVRKPSARLQYVFKLLFEHVLPTPYRIIQQMEDGLDVVLNYTGEAVENSYFIPNSGLLDQTDIREIQLGMGEYKGLPYNFGASKSSGHPFDLFSMSFWLATEYERHHQTQFDRFERYLPNHPFQQKQFLRQPIIHQHLIQLFQDLKLPIQLPAYRYELTFDIDNPWRYLHKPLFVQVGGLIKRSLQGNFTEVYQQLSTFIHRQDPHDVYDRIFQLAAPAHTRFFFLLGGSSIHDNRFSAEHPQLQNLIRKTHQAGYTIGIHPSFHSLHQPELIQQETQALSKIIQQPITHSRQHFLRYRLPQTFRSLIQAGIRHEYSLCSFHQNEFRTGIAVPYPWFDLERNEETPLILHPSLAMDKSMQHYMKHNPSEAVAEVKRIVNECKKVGGKMCLLLHNDSLSEVAEWKGWRSAIIEMIGLCL